MAKSKCIYANIRTKATTEKNKFGAQKVVTEIFCPFHPTNYSNCSNKKVNDFTINGNNRVEKFCLNKGYSLYGNHTLYVCRYYPEKNELSQSKNYIAVHEE